MFNLSKYMEYQYLLREKYKNKEINDEEYSRLSDLFDEHREVERRIDIIKNYILDKNLPFKIELTSFNIQTLLQANSEILEGIEKVISRDIP